jgi:DNA-binding PadR family transcriptional regulator
MTGSEASTIDLVILGLLNNQPMSAYELTKLTGIYELVKVSQPAIYKNVHKLSQKGYLHGRTTRIGKLPEKTIYEITSAGKEQILELMQSCVTARLQFHFDFNSFLLLIEQIPGNVANRLLRELMTRLLENKQRLQEQATRYSHLSLTIRALANQHILLNEALIRWLKDFMDEFQPV